MGAMANYIHARPTSLPTPRFTSGDRPKETARRDWETGTTVSCSPSSLVPPPMGARWVGALLQDHRQRCPCSAGADLRDRHQERGAGDVGQATGEGRDAPTGSGQGRQPYLATDVRDGTVKAHGAKAVQRRLDAGGVDTTSPEDRKQGKGGQDRDTGAAGCGGGRDVTEEAGGTFLARGPRHAARHPSSAKGYRVDESALASLASLTTCVTGGWLAW